MIYILRGNDQYFVKKKLDELLKENPGDVIEFNGSLKGFDIKEMLESCTSNSLFSASNCVVVKDPFFLINKAEDREKDIRKVLDYCAEPIYENTLIFYTLDNSFNGNLSTYKEIAKNAQVIECNQLKYYDFERYCISILNDSKIDITSDARKSLINSAKCDATSFHNNLEVLKLYPGKIDINVLNALCSRNNDNDAFDLVNALINKETNKTFELARLLAIEESSVQGLIGLIASQLRFLYYVGYLRNQRNSQNDIANIIHCHPYRIQKAFESLEKLDYIKIPKLLSDLSDFDVICKSDSTIDENERFEIFLLRLLKR